jgi:acetylornithine deacetylase/succinyl-diaminopimelate desuccinylase-like protein
MSSDELSIIAEGLPVIQSVRESDGIDWDAIRAEAAQMLSRYLQIKTVNPPGDEIEGARWLAEILRAEGIEPAILESAPGRANLVARLPGRGEGLPLILLSHIDVVTAQEEAWTHPPFGGEIAEGFIWGRGALDMKDTTIQHLLCLLIMKRHGIVPKRDLILLAVADEEAGGFLGAKWMVENHPELLQPSEAALSEVGGFQLYIEGRRFYPIQVGEKGGAPTKLIANGRPSHASMPHNDQAVVHLARALHELGTTPLPQHNTNTITVLTESIANVLPEPHAEEFRKLLDPRFSAAIIERYFAPTGMAGFISASLRNTATPTLLKAGEKLNVIPGYAEATLDCRLLPGYTAADLVKEIQAVIGNEYSLDVLREGKGIETGTDTPLYRTLTEIVRRNDPDGIAVPYMAPGGTDARHLIALGIPTYGFAPVLLPVGMSMWNMFHANDERIPVAGLLFGIKMLYDVLREY